ncbi:MAG: IS5/IS1182 family transposase, partial [Chlorobiota bacterium]|nr:IS5/IS1182 family transposase [Chlorobiota bacterium]
DSEPTHRWLREEQGIESIIPATGCCPGRDRTLYRRRMQRYFPRRKYGRRWIAETVASVLKRRFGEALTTRRWWQ